MAAPATRSTTLHSLGALRQLVTGPSQDEPRLVLLADAVTALIESETGRAFVSRSLTETYDGTGTSVLMLRSFPVVSVTSMTIRRTLEGADEAIAGGSYRIHGSTGRIELFPSVSPFTCGLGTVTITYTAGFGAQDAATLPADIVDASIELIKMKLGQSDAGGLAASQVSIGGGSFVVRQEIPWQVRRVLDAWIARKV